MIKVLQILPGINRGGLETFVMNIYRSIDRGRIQFEFLTNMNEGDYSQEILELGGIIHYLPPRREGYSRYLRNLQKFFSSHKGYFDAVHYHESSLTSLEPLYFAKKVGIPIRIMHSHSSMVKGNKLHLVMHLLGKLFIGKLATDYLGCSDKALKWMYKYSGKLSQSKIIKNGIDTSKFNYNPTIHEEVRNRIKINNQIVIGHVGRFMPVKNHKFLIDIFYEVKKIEPDALLLLVGDGELLGTIKEYSCSLGIQDEIRFLGVRDDINKLMQAMDGFVMPSLYEGLPVVLVEAQASGLPVFCSDTISLMSKLTDNYHILSLKDKPADWAQKIIKEIRKFKRETTTAQIIKAGFDISTTTKLLSDLYAGK